MSFRNGKREKLLLVNFDGKNYHDQRSVASRKCLSVKLLLFPCLHNYTLASLTTVILFMLLAAEYQGRLLPNIICTASQRQQVFDSRCAD